MPTPKAEVSPVVDVPATFPPGVKLYDVEGVPVTVGKVPGVEGLNVAWDFPEPRLFPMDSVLRNGTRVSPEAFRRLVSAARAEVRAGS